ncbi:DUF1642 domain-containing protein [Streptococcus equi]|uniref:DUF1642 domain-containing protein n=1 Tax=Streptococcus equi TaxID=1336 RepID=UPI00065A0E5B|nr:DUF1642 domain-containing protein [Streptococcus equi]HEL1049477.1 DUF1642 domain-containing protein [Streptococcus equi subsp. zooepidemicus]MBT1200703.1 DUF1642 domain-containing protein [Streptococcus equi subsp. equi]MBT1211113.1 DUF1642 domain-containing protein [Streptococcus equi subsp. equi]MBT1218672.1 DUF1642 domain-containing protein [Streptococcus equi subsp. equi]CRR16290.1 phage protein [Streptococcus equi subsp. equi]
MNIEEAIKYFEDKKKGYIVTPSQINVSTVEVINILKQIKLDKLMPEIPQFVADWIEDHKQSFADSSAIDMYENLTHDNRGGYYHDVWLWAIDHHNDFVFAWVYGYTVEKENLYIVEIPNPNSGIEHKHIALARLANGKLGFSEIIDTDFYSREDVRLTESEIRKDFDWAWREEFTKEVTE